MVLFLCIDDILLGHDLEMLKETKCWLSSILKLKTLVKQVMYLKLEIYKESLKETIQFIPREFC